MTCCPPNSEPFLFTDYQANGTKLFTSDGVEYYFSGNKTSTKGILIASDVYGWNSGRIRAIADYLGGAGYSVALLKLLSPPPLDEGSDGDGFLDMSNRAAVFESLKKFDFDVLKPQIASVMSTLQLDGVTSFAILGFCWGAWAMAQILASELSASCSCGIGVHPSVSIEERIFSRDTLALVNNINKPVFFMPTIGDPDDYREGGAFTASLLSRFPATQTLDFPTVNHGFAVRGDINDPTVKEAVELCLNKITEFLAANL